MKKQGILYQPVLCKISINSVYYVFVFVAVACSNMSHRIFLERSQHRMRSDRKCVISVICVLSKEFFNHVFLTWVMVSFSGYYITNVKKVCLFRNWSKIGLFALYVVSTYFWDTTFAERYILERIRYITRKHMECKLMNSFTPCVTIL